MFSFILLSFINTSNPVCQNIILYGEGVLNQVEVEVEVEEDQYTGQYITGTTLFTTLCTIYQT